MVKNLTDCQREEVKDFLLMNNTKMIMHPGKLKEASLKWKVSSRSISTIWTIIRRQNAAGVKICVKSKKKGKKGPAKITIDITKVKAMKLADRKSLDRFSKCYGVGRSTVWRWIKLGLLKAHTNSVHPLLTQKHKLLRLKFSLGALVVDRILGKIKFRTMSNVIHIDEKWFYLTEICGRYYLVPGEEEPYRSCQSKRYITKVMFMCTVARPQFGENGECLFDGKIGIFPFTKQVAAQRSSRNRPAGTMETKAVESVTKAVVKACIINEIIPAIKRKWPASASKHIIIQQDNATPHILGNDADFLAAARSDGFHIKLKNQPPQSPDMNINDLGFFRAIQSLQRQTGARNVVELLDAVTNAFEQLEPTTLNKIWISLQACLIEVMKRRGHNDYRLPHLKKAALQRRGQLPQDLQVDECLVRECIEHLIAVGAQVDNDRLMQQLGYTTEN